MEKETIALIVIVSGLILSFCGLWLIDRLWKWPNGSRW